MAARLGLRRVGQYGSPTDAGDDHMAVQCKVGGAFPELLWRWLQALPRDRLRAVSWATRRGRGTAAGRIDRARPRRLRGVVREGGRAVTLSQRVLRYSLAIPGETRIADMPVGQVLSVGLKLGDPGRIQLWVAASPNRVMSARHFVVLPTGAAVPDRPAVSYLGTVVTRGRRGLARLGDGAPPVARLGGREVAMRPRRVPIA